jgi:hypothetical protein
MAMKHFRKRILRLAGAVILAAACLVAAGAQPSAARERPQPVDHTPWLALRFVQDGREAPMVQRDLLTTEVRLRRRPFQLLLPRRGQDDAYQLTAWTDRSIFRRAPVGVLVRDMEAETPTYFSPGTGLADTAAGSGTLFLDPEGHNYLGGLRLGPDPARHVVYYSGIFRGGREVPLERVRGPIHLVVFFDENDDGVVDHGEYEFVTLRFTR